MERGIGVGDVEAGGIGRRGIRGGRIIGRFRLQTNTAFIIFFDKCIIFIMYKMKGHQIIKAIWCPLSYSLNWK